MRMILKPNNGHKQHHIAGVTILEQGREAVVDEQIPQFLVDEAVEPEQPGKPIDFSKPRKTLVLSPAAYAHFKGEFGKALVCEPLGGVDAMVARVDELEEQLEEKSAEVDQLRARVAELEEQLATKGKGKTTKAADVQPAKAEPAPDKA